MSCKVHNVRFYSPKPESIKCLAFQSESFKLAAFRENVGLEIWNLNDAPFIEMTIVSQSNNQYIQDIAWYGNRLFSVGLEGYLFEYDSKTATQKHIVSVTGEAVYCMDIHGTGKIAVGTETGYLNIFQAQDDCVEFDKFLDKQEGKIMCLKYHKSGNVLVSGSFGAVRIWDIKTGHALHRMTTGKASNNLDTIVWCIDILEDMTIVTGDSRGMLTFWDGKVGTQIESYQSHQADILSLVISEDEKNLYCAGVDSTICNYVQIKVRHGGRKWVKSVPRRVHDNDVNSLILHGDKLYSGGVDGYLACSYHPPKTLLKYPPILQHPCISVSVEKKYIMMRYPKHIEVWSLGEYDANKCEESYTGLVPVIKRPVKLLELERTVKQDDGEVFTENIVCCALSPNGKYIAFSTTSIMRLFTFSYENEKAPRLEPIDLPENFSSRVLKFTRGSNELVAVSHKNEIRCLALNGNLIDSMKDIDYKASDLVTFIEFSSCNKYMVIGGVGNKIVVLKRHKALWLKHYKLPKYSSSPTALAMHPKTNNLWVVYADNKIFEFDLELRTLTQFAKNLDKRISNLLHKSFCIRNLMFDPRKPNIVILHDDTTILVINKDKKLPASDAKIPKIDSSQLSSDLSNDSSASLVMKHAVHSIRKYKHLVHLEWVSDDEMIAVEVSPLSLLEQLPPCLKRNMFGTQ